MAETTPMMLQYLQIREQYRDAVLFFRLGDFYEMFNDDAIEVSRLLNLTLTHRGDNPMCGIPYHASRVYIARLLRLGKKIAICEQISLPTAGKGLAERRVVEVITPGTVIDEEYLDDSVNNYLAAVCKVQILKKDFLAFACIDVSTGTFFATSFPFSRSADGLRKELGRIAPRELLVQHSLLDSGGVFGPVLDDYPAMVVNKFPDWSFSSSSAYKRLCSLFSTGNLKAFDLDENSPELAPAGLLVDYIGQTAGSALEHVKSISVYHESDFVILDEATRKNLELVQNLRDGSPAYTLFEVLHDTRTSMGTRLLRRWIQFPLRDVVLLENRLDTVERLFRNQSELSAIRSVLSVILDIERLAGRVAMKRAHGKDLVALGKSLHAFCSLFAHVVDYPYFLPVIDQSVADVARIVSQTLESSLNEDCPVLLSDGGIIREGWSARLDELRLLQKDSSRVLDGYLEDEKKKTGIQNLKIRYNRMIGYYLEVTKGNLGQVPDHFIRRRSLANGDRFTTDRLVELEAELKGLESSIFECEQSLFYEIRDSILPYIQALHTIAHIVSEIDVLQSFARCATIHAWNRPCFATDGSIRYTEGRHPVVEHHLPTGEFIPNDLLLSSGTDTDIPSFALITGPNMAGKSTFLRQTALLAIMAQIGSFVPASEFCIHIVDRIFCRVGASDNLARGESTFLVEMTETAHILRTATRESLVIMDEVGRGTSTEDGLSIARAVSEYLLSEIGCKTLFATHYHELSRLEHGRLVNLCLEVLETEGTVVFLKRVVPGASANSYGIHVARLAGVPEAVIQRALTLVGDLDVKRQDLPSIVPENLSDPVDKPLSSGHNHFPGLFSEEELVLNDILSTDINSITPFDALSLIDRWKKRLFPGQN